MPSDLVDVEIYDAPYKTCCLDTLRQAVQAMGGLHLYGARIFGIIRSAFS